MVVQFLPRAYPPPSCVGAQDAEDAAARVAALERQRDIEQRIVDAARRLQAMTGGSKEAKQQRKDSLQFALASLFAVEAKLDKLKHQAVGGAPPRRPSGRPSAGSAP